MKRPAIAVFLCLLTGLAWGGTFELSDPASEIYEDFEKQKQKAEEEATSPRPEGPAASQPQAVRSTSEPHPAGGVGGTPCPDMISYRQDAPRWYEVRLSWALGYVNASMDQAGAGSAPPSAGAPTPEALEGWLEFYCRENPDVNLAQAAEAFVRFRTSGG